MDGAGGLFQGDELLGTDSGRGDDVEGVDRFDTVVGGLHECGIGDRREIGGPDRYGREEALVEGDLGAALVEAGLGQDFELEEDARGKGAGLGSSRTARARVPNSPWPLTPAIKTLAST